MNVPIDEQIVRHPNGHLMVERTEAYTPSRESTSKWLASLSKAWPILADHANWMDGEFDLALTDLRRGVEAFHEYVDRVRAASASPLSDAQGAETPPEHCGVCHYELPSLCPWCAKLTASARAPGAETPTPLDVKMREAKQESAAMLRASLPPATRAPGTETLGALLDEYASAVEAMECASHGDLAETKVRTARAAVDAEIAALTARVARAERIEEAARRVVDSKAVMSFCVAVSGQALFDLEEVLKGGQ